MAGSSFRQGGCSLKNLADLHVSAKQVERVVRRIGQERVDQRDAAVEAFLRLPLAEKSRAPAGVSPPSLAVVMADGGRIQILERGQPEQGQAHPAAKPPDPAGPGQTAAPTSDGNSPPTGHDTAGSVASLAGSSEPPPLPDEGGEEDDLPVPQPGSRSQHWREDKVGLLLHMSSPQGKEDPCPEIPEHFVEQKRVEKLARELKAKARGNAAQAGVAEADSAGEPATAGGDEPGTVAAGVPEPAGGSQEGEEKGSKDEKASWEPPKLKARKVVATRRRWRCFGPILAAAAWSLGFFAAERKAFLGDGSSAVWGVWRRHFSSFVPIVDFIHALSYVYSAAMAGRAKEEGWAVYQRWISWVWQGEVSKVIEELQKRRNEVGLPSKDDKETSPQVVIKEALTFLENHKGQMKYDQYRKDGLPITTSHVESEIKRINQRVKGSEKFWSEDGAEFILQLRADYLSDDKPMDVFWQDRVANESGQRRYRKSR
jgi:hypothetical protein